MNSMSRRSVINGSIGFIAMAPLARPHIANAAASTAVVWQVQGFVPEEDAAFRKTVADYEKASGNKIDLSVMPFQALNQKAISAITGGDVPDLIFHDAPATILPQNAWNDKLVDVSDVVDTYRSRLSETALLNSTFYNGTTKQRSFYLAPVKQATSPFHIWGDLVTKAGFKLSDAPKTWDAFWDFFKPVQKELRAKGMRKLYAMGLQITTVGPNDGNGLFYYFMVANGGQDIGTRDGKLHTDDPKVREAAIRSVEYMTNCYKEGYVPPEALTWNDADDNNAYHEKLFVMDLDGTLSTELAMIKNKKAYYEEAVVMGLPNRNDGSTMPCFLGAGGGFIPKGAKSIEVAKDFMKYFMQPRGDEREFEEWPGSLGAGLSADREGRPVVDGYQERPASVGLCSRGGAGADHTRLQRFQSGVGPGERRAALGPVPCRCHQERHDASAGGRQGVPARRSDLY